ncbi:hypothetical protein AB0O26_12140, partial [Micrococcus luteus]|uniref:hypothetical protein n=1 Tax=Micrococcus luteus TaxID=1270 RepID=UPI00343E33D5
MLPILTTGTASDATRAAAETAAQQAAYFTALNTLAADVDVPQRGTGARGLGDRARGGPRRARTGLAR